MVSRRLLAAALALILSACGAVWGFEPLSLGTGSDAGSEDADDRADSAVTPHPAAANVDGGLQGMWCGASGASCACSRNQAGNGQACSAESLGVDPTAVLCCADPSYPNSGSCTCDWIGCTTDTSNSANCQCAPGNDKPGGSCAPDDAWKCCRLTGSILCMCSAVDCIAGFEPMGNQCTISDLRCPGTKHQVTTCN